jgi:hypothetical protein
LSPISATYEPLSHGQDRTTVIAVAWGQLTGEDLATIIDDQMELEPVEPVHRIFATLGQARKDTMRFDAAVVTNYWPGRNNKREAVTLTAARLQIGRKRYQDSGYQIDKTGITGHPRKLRPQVGQDVFGVECLEIPIV